MRGDDLLVELGPGPEVDLGVRGEVAAHPLLAAADLEQTGVLLLGPAEREAQLLEGLVEGHEVAVALGVGQHAVAVEDQRPGHAVTTLAAAPALPSWSMCSRTVPFTASVIWSNIFTGSHFPFVSASAMCA